MMDCGPTCLKIIAKFYGKNINISTLTELSEIGKDGVNLLGLSQAAESIGFRTLSVEIDYEKLITEAPLPCVIHWDQNHFVVITPGSSKKKVVIADPAHGILSYSVEDFKSHWLQSLESDTGIALLIEPTPKFHLREEEAGKKISWGFLYQYVGEHRRFIFQLIIGMLLTSLFQMIMPFLTQSIVDVGINGRNIQYIYLILIAQLFLTFGRTVTDFIRSRLLLHIGTKINISILSDFWIKLMRLPLSYFDQKKTGDILQRIGDHNRIQNFLTTSVLTVAFSILNLIVFSIVLLVYNPIIYLIFMIGSLIYFFWIKLFLSARRDLDVKRFHISSKENSATMQLINGMQEIRMNNCGTIKRWEWERLQVKIFQLSFKGLSLSQFQQTGGLFINETKNILISFIVAKAVIDGQLTFGGMLAVQYMIGQLNSPIDQLIGFVQNAQDAKISLERLNEIHELEEEESLDTTYIKQLRKCKSISIKDLSFTYVGAGNEPVLNKINIEITEGKTTAIVGMSGSGKSTILKLLSKFYTSYSGEIKIGESNLKYISPDYWRKQCGSVMQDGYIFNDTIAKNIALLEERPDYDRLSFACETANILTFIESLPAGFNTMIGNEGNGISQGQKQRILIARLVYKNPSYLFLDEATNSLDSNNEEIIVNNMKEFYLGKTVVIVAHRLSTVIDADEIIVLNKGVIVEKGKHQDLVNKKGYYYELVRKQLALKD